MTAMKPSQIQYDAGFEKQWLKYLKKLSAKEKEQLKERLALFKEDAFDKRLKPTTSKAISKPTTPSPSPTRTG